LSPCHKRKGVMPALEDAASAWAGRQVVKVRHAAGGWTVSNALIGEPLMFGSRRQAEQRAKSLAGRIAKMGFDSRVDMHDRDDALIGTIWFWREAAPGPPVAEAGRG
jgi:hypothetical protein